MNLTEDTWARLLASFDRDPRIAASRYEHLRTRLIAKFRFGWAAIAEDLADETFDRVARRLGAEVVVDIERYVFGVARFVMLESGRHARRHCRFDDGRAIDPTSEPHEPDDRGERIEQLARVLDELPADARALLLRYETGRGGERIAQRKDLASELGIPVNALRIRACRLRKRIAEAFATAVPLAA